MDPRVYAVCVSGEALLNALKAAYGHHYPAGMTELWEFEKALKALEVATKTEEK